jgi:hypothetical protein
MTYGIPSLTETYDRETNRRKRNPQPRPTNGGGGVVTNSETGIMAQLRRGSNDHTEIIREYVDRTDNCVCHSVDRGRVADCPVHTPERFSNTRPANPGTGTVELARPQQVGLVYVLLKQLANHNPDVEAPARAWFERNKETISKVQISDVIDRLKGHLSRPVSITDQPVTHEPKSNVWAEWRKLAAHLVTFGGNHGARFAVDNEDGATNSISFWWIVPNEGPNGTRYFLRQVIGGHEAPVRVRMSPEAMISIARKIAVDPKAAMLRFGREIGECGHCGRVLTNDESRARGIGPVCAGKKGW